MQCVTYGQATDRWVKMVSKETITHQINSDSLVNFSQFSLFVVFETDAWCFNVVLIYQIHKSYRFAACHKSNTATFSLHYECVKRV